MDNITKFTESEEQIILKNLEKYKGNSKRVATKLGISERAVITLDIMKNKKYNYTAEGLGPKHLQQYIIGVRSTFSDQGWGKSSKIIEARKLYDQGLVEIATGRDGMNFILYAIPRREKINRKPYFSKTVETNVYMIG